MHLDRAAWTEVRRLYTEDTVPLRTLALRFGVSATAISARAKREGWPSRPKGAPVSIKTRKGKRGRAPHTSTVEATQVAAKSSDVTPGHAPGGEARPAAEAEGAGETRLPSRQARKVAISRLFRAITVKLEQMERRMANGEERSAQDEERETRALSTMIRNFEKVTEAVSDFEKPREQERAATGAPAMRADAERMRRELTQRLERLARGRDAARTPRKP